MAAQPVRIAVVGHTNTGKTSLLRTLARDVGFGEVSDRPAVTRHVEGTALLVDGRPVLELYDTPGLEDSSGLLEQLDGLAARRERDEARRPDGIDVISGFLEAPQAEQRFGQEARALRQVLRCDAALYVVDARDRVLGKHRDELEILRRCARPIVPVLNFTADPAARTAEWREHLSRAALHAVAEFDTVVYDEAGERRLYEKMASLLDSHRAAFKAVITNRREQRRRLTESAARLLAEMLIDVAAHVSTVPVEDERRMREAVETLRELVRRREERCVRQLLELFRFRPDDATLDDLGLVEGRWGLDLFSPAAMRHFGIRATGAAAAGAVAGLAIDAMTGGLTLGADAAAGAAAGALLETGRSWGRKLIDRARGLTELRVDDRTLLLLMKRQAALIRALLRRGHAAMDPVRLDGEGGGPLGALTRPHLPHALREARGYPRWSVLSRKETTGEDAAAPPIRPAVTEARAAAESALAREIVGMVE